MSLSSRVIAWCCVALSCLVLSCLVLFCVVLSRVASCVVWSYLTLSRCVLCCLFSPCFVFLLLSCPRLFICACLFVSRLKKSYTTGNPMRLFAIIGLCFRLCLCRGLWLELWLFLWLHLCTAVATRSLLLYVRQQLLSCLWSSVFRCLVFRGVWLFLGPPCD